VDSLDVALHQISGCDRAHFSNEAERLCGMLRSNLDYTNIETVFSTGLHQHLDQTQLRLIEICNALVKTYCLWLDEE
jgi:uncharacterized alpha-E superfamily protein